MNNDLFPPDPLASPGPEDEQGPSEAAESCNSLILEDPLRFTRLNQAQERFIRSTWNPCQTLTICPFLKGNGLGGSYALVAAWSAIMFGTAHRLFRCSPYGERWPFFKDIRLATTTASLSDTGPIQRAMHELFPAGRWQQSHGVGKSFYSEGKSDTGFTWDIVTYNQSPQECASSTKGLILFSEPPPASTFTEVVARLRGRGLCLMDMTQLDMGEAIENIVDDGLVLNGERVGEVRVTRGDAHESCEEHCGGHRPHAAIMADIASWPEDEREARRTGQSMRLSGRIYPKWGDSNELLALPKYHQEHWDNGNVRVSCVMDEADRRPWAISWFATFPNEDVVNFAEFPNFDYWSCKSSPISDVEDYRGVILETEAEFGGRRVVNRIDDPLFGGTPGKGNANTLRGMLAGPCRQCRKDSGVAEGDPEDCTAYQSAMKRCQHRLIFQPGLAYDGSIRDGHILVRAAVGDVTEGVRPKVYSMRQSCPNMCRGMRRYSWKENRVADRGLSNRPALVYKDFPDLWRLGMLKGFQKWPTPTKPMPTVDVRGARPGAIRRPMSA